MIVNPLSLHNIMHCNPVIFLLFNQKTPISNIQVLEIWIRLILKRLGWISVEGGDWWGICTGEVVKRAAAMGWWMEEMGVDWWEEY